MGAKEDRLTELLALQKRTEHDIERLRTALQEAIEPASATDDDSADAAADIYERGKTISVIQSLQVKLHSIEHAIEVVQQGAYGICEKCGESIPDERLAIMPETTLCVRCASELERGIHRHRLQSRPVRRRTDMVDPDGDSDSDSD